nr:zinc finger MYM-type protein 1-like [Onthophagus taurus]
MDIYNDPNPAGYSGNIMRVEAKGIVDGISTFKFLVSFITWYNILFEINITSKLLQNKNADIFVCTKQLEVTKNYLVSCRSDENFEKNLSDATLLANELDIDANFPNAPSRRRKIKKQFDYEAEGVSIQDPKQNYKISFYYMIIDNAVNAIQERFNQMQEYCALFGFLYDIFNLKDKNEADILMQCKKFESALTHNSCKDIYGEDLCWELQSVSRRLPKVMGPSEVLLFILRHDLQNSVPNIYVALRILLTLPVSVASGERSFSRLKLIKTYLRLTMTEERLVGLATISIEQELAYNLDLCELISLFAVAF